jgi:hypothetical protein
MLGGAGGNDDDEGHMKNCKTSIHVSDCSNTYHVDEMMLLVMMMMMMVVMMM